MTVTKILLMIIVMNTNSLYALDYTHRKGFREYSLKNELDYLKKYDGMYPNRVKLLGNNSLTKRLKSLLKSRYNFLVKTWGPETPIEINKNIFIAWGCQQHNCSNTNFTIVVDFAKNIIYVGIREEENVSIYSEDGSSSVQILKWANRN